MGNFMKSLDLSSSKEDGIKKAYSFLFDDYLEKAHQVGDTNSKGEVWVEYKPGKFDWRPAKHKAVLALQQNGGGQQKPAAQSQPSGNAGGQQKQQPVNPKKNLSDYAKNVDDNVLKRAIEESNDENVINAAKQELKKRNENKSDKKPKITKKLLKEKTKGFITPSDIGDFEIQDRGDFFIVSTKSKNSDRSENYIFTQDGNILGSKKYDSFEEAKNDLDNFFNKGKEDREKKIQQISQKNSSVILDLKNRFEKINNDSSISGNQVENDPDLEKILKNGKDFSEREVIENLGVNGECHWNISKLYDEGKIDSIVIGYAYDPRCGWLQHTFGLKDNKVVETNIGCRDVENYYGMVLSEDESKLFVDACKRFKPGEGKIRAGVSNIIKQQSFN